MIILPLLFHQQTANWISLQIKKERTGSDPTGTDKSNAEKNTSLPSLFCYLEAITWFQFVVTMYGEKDPLWKRGKTLHHQIGFLISHLVTIPFGPTQRSDLFDDFRVGAAGDLPHPQNSRTQLCFNLLLCFSGLFSTIFLLLACLSFFCVSSS